MTKPAPTPNLTGSQFTARPRPWAVLLRPVPPTADLNHPGLYLNSELSRLDFNWRVLHQALDERHPLLERLRFMAMAAGNLDEFVQKRVGHLKRQEAAGVQTLSADGLTPAEQLRQLSPAIQAMQRALTETWENLLKPLLRRQAGIIVLNYADLRPAQQQAMRHYFQTQIYHLLTPVMVEPGQPWPAVSNLSLSLAVTLRQPRQKTAHFARLTLPAGLPRFVPVLEADGPVAGHFLPAEQLLAHHAADFFPGLELIEAQPFRVTRAANANRDDDDEATPEQRERRPAPVVRLEVAHTMPAAEQQRLRRELELAPTEVCPVSGLLDLAGCRQLANLNLPDFQFKPWTPIVPDRLIFKGEAKTAPDIFAVIRQGDVLLHHPYESFSASVLQLIEEAAADERVLAIKQTLGYAPTESPLVQALMRAAEADKQVAVLVNANAQSNEAAALEWARTLENAGVQVAYGLAGLNTHAQATLIVRREDDGLRTYCHIGTGSYHPARHTSDVGLLTGSPELGRDLVNLFHGLTGYALNQTYRQAVVAPQTMRPTFNALIDREIEHQNRHGSGKIIAKMNALDDVDLIRRLYKASQAGVQIDLMVRGHTRLRPGLPGFSDNIRLISLVGRFLEHDRIYHFHNNGQPLTYIGSADWCAGSLDDRVELLVPVHEPAQQQRLLQILTDALADNRLAWDLNAEGDYTLRHPETPETERNFHTILMKQALTRAHKAIKPQRK